MTRQYFDKAQTLIGAANNEDPNQEIIEGQIWPKELLYSHRMSDMLERYSPNADDAIKLAVRGAAHPALENATQRLSDGSQGLSSMTSRIEQIACRSYC